MVQSGPGSWVKTRVKLACDPVRKGSTYRMRMPVTAFDARAYPKYAPLGQTVSS